MKEDVYHLVPSSFFSLISYSFLANTIKKFAKKRRAIMGAIERSGYRFVPEFSVIQQNGAIHVYNQDQFVEEITFQFYGKFPELDQIEDLVEEYCIQHNL
jgi:hypothetical protein